MFHAPARATMKCHDGCTCTRCAASAMRERAARIGGTLKISSQPGAGTGIELTVPNPKRTTHAG